MENQNQPIITNAADESQVSDGKKLAKRLRDRELMDMRSVLNTRQGRNVIWKILGFCGTGADQYEDNALRMARKTGMKLVGLKIIKEIQDVDDEFYFKMQREDKEKKI